MDCCKVLLMRGADKNIINNDGKTAALVSKIKSNSLITQLIENFKSSEISWSSLQHLLIQQHFI